MPGSYWKCNGPCFSIAKFFLILCNSRLQREIQCVFFVFIPKWTIQLTSSRCSQTTVMTSFFVWVNWQYEKKICINLGRVFFLINKFRFQGIFSTELRKQTKTYNVPHFLMNFKGQRMHIAHEAKHMLSFAIIFEPSDIITKKIYFDLFFSFFSRFPVERASF